MMMLVFSPRGIPANYRTQQGFGVNTYKSVNAAGETKLVKSPWLPKQGVKSLTAADAAVVSREPRPPHEGSLRRGRRR